MEALAQSIVRQGGAMLIVDYGYEGPAVGDTLQAVKGHSYADVFADIGEADLTAHVDFTALAEVARRTGARTFGPVRSEEHPSELQSLMAHSYAVFCLKKKINR